MRELSIAYGASRQAKKWVNKKITYADLKEKLKNPIRTPESAEEYARMGKGERDQAKDHGGFVGGTLSGGRRTADSVESRSMISLDGDRYDRDALQALPERIPWGALIYSTHSHTPEHPRIRIILPLARDVNPEEYAALSRYAAQALGIESFDECSYLPNQLMYWPSAPMNGEYLFREIEKPWLDPDSMLQEHPEWRDPTRLPTSSRESAARGAGGKKAQDPLGKTGVIGLFNRAFFPIQKAIDTFLSDIYEPTDRENRYHLKTSSSMAGVEVKEDKFVYSHHAKDPAYLRLCNAYDIVRIHKFGAMGEAESVRAMNEFATGLDAVKILAAKERQAGAEADFAPPAEGNDEQWKTQLEYESRSMRLANSLKNITLILQNDRALQSIVFNQLADGMEIKGPVPWKHPAKFWRDADDAQLISYVDSHYGTFSARNYEIAVAKVADDRSYHPIREMFERLPPWDGVHRVDTLLVDYLGAADNAYTRSVTRKALCAAYARIMQPGIKFDSMIVLNGPQGIGKSTLIARLGMEWFNDCLNLSDMNDKTAAEKLQGYWLMEISELAGMKRADVDKVKAFVSRQDDKYRASFGRRVTPHPRQCVFFGTTNTENGYLRDITGNRRFWNVKVNGQGKRKPWELDRESIRMIWAETMVLARAGEPLYLNAEMESLAQEEQVQAMEQDEREGVVAAYLEMELPESWDTMDLFKRREYIRAGEDDLFREKGVKKRKTVSNMEIWCECFGKNKEDLRTSDSYAISAIMMKMKGWEKGDERERIPIYGRQRLYYRK